MAKVGVILSGCGVFDGSEIHESVLMLLSLDQRGAEYECLAPDKPFDAINHATKKPAHETRNVLAESARIARGNIRRLSEVKGDEYDAFVLPGGFGAAKSGHGAFSTRGEPAICTVLRLPRCSALWLVPDVAYRAAGSTADVT